MNLLLFSQHWSRKEYTNSYFCIKIYDITQYGKTFKTEPHFPTVPLVKFRNGQVHDRYLSWPVTKYMLHLLYIVRHCPYLFQEGYALPSLNVLYADVSDATFATPYNTLIKL